MLIFKRSEVCTFVLPKVRDGVSQLSPTQDEALFAGLNWLQMVAKQGTPPNAAGWVMPRF